MNSLIFKNGIYINNFLIDTAYEKKFKSQISQALNADQLNVKEYNGYITYSFLCVYLDIKFRFYVVFNNNQRNSDPYLVWLEGICEQKKWESSEKDLYSDIETLKKKLESSGFLPYKEKENLIYYYTINKMSIVLRGSLKSMSTIIGIEL